MTLTLVVRVNYNKSGEWDIKKRRFNIPLNGTETKIQIYKKIHVVVAKNTPYHHGACIQLYHSIVNQYIVPGPDRFMVQKKNNRFCIDALISFL